MEGFEIPIHRSLTQPIMIGGVPREIAILNGTLSAALPSSMRRSSRYQQSASNQPCIQHSSWGMLAGSPSSHCSASG